MPDTMLVDYVNEFGCSKGEFSFLYLGLSIGVNMKLTNSWKSLVDRFHKKLSDWKANLHSIGGRLTLIKTVLGSLCIYYLSLFKCPEMVLHKRERLRVGFFSVERKMKEICIG
ncbi:uncharacterized protein [Rutidosis leptorrhynchoides]|uniref:uncharacterized protein n=1 Tax=Rutidosis leptorrhynchoides TaxID=125765 RepID=UPI003A99F8F0